VQQPFCQRTSHSCSPRIQFSVWSKVVLVDIPVFRRSFQISQEFSWRNCKVSKKVSILPSHIIIQNYHSVPRHHSELFLRPTSSIRTILASHVTIRSYSCVPRHHSEVLSRRTSIRIILAFHVVIRELFFRSKIHSIP